MIQQFAFHQQRTTFGLAMVGILFATMTMHAQLDRSLPPAPGPAPIVHLGEHTSFTLKNGMRVIVVENHKLPMVSLQVRFDIPPFDEGDKAGFVDLVSELLMSGTKEHNKENLDEEVDRLGATLNTSSDGLYASTLKKNLDPIMGLVREVIQSPIFPEEEFIKARNRFQSGVQQRQDDPEAISEVVGKAAIFGLDHPYGEVTTVETLANVDVGTVRAFHEHYFRPETGFLVFVGDLDQKEAEKIAQTYFGDWRPAGNGRTPDVAGELIPGIGGVKYLSTPKLPPTYRQAVIVDRPDAPQSAIRVSYPLNLVPKDIRALNAQVLNTILGGGVFNARLMQNLREDKGYTYGAYSSIESDRYNGNFTASTNVRTEVTADAIKQILAEMERLRNEPVPQEDLDLAKKYMAGSFARSLEDPRTVARFALNTYLYGLQQDHYATYLKRLEKVTVADVQAAAVAFLHPDNAVLFVVCDRERVRRSLIPLSLAPFIPVLELDVDGNVKEDHLEMAGDTTVDVVINAYLNAIGGRKAIAKLGNMERTWKGTVGGSELIMTERFGTGSRYQKSVFADHTVQQLVVCDGERAIDVIGGTGEEVEGDALKELKLWAEPVPEATVLHQPMERFMDGRTTIGGKPVYKITTNVGTIEVTTDYFDVVTGLKMRHMVTQRNFGQTYLVTIDYSDYREVNGVKFPHSIEQDGGISGVISAKLEEIKLDPKFDAETFSLTSVISKHE